MRQVGGETNGWSATERGSREPEARWRQRFFNRHLLCVYCVVGTGDTAVDEKDRSLPSQREHSSGEDQQ